MFSELLLLAVIFLFSLAFYKWATLNNDYFERRKIKYLKPKFLVGNTGGILLNRYNAAEISQMIYQQFPDEQIYGMFDFRFPQYIVRDLEIMKRIGVKEFDHFEDHRGFTDEKTDKFWGNALIFLKGQKWRMMRATLSPAFTGNKMKQMFELVAECSHEVVTYFLTKSKNGDRINVEMKDLFSRYTNDVIASCAFGLKINSFIEPDNEFYLNGKEIMNFSGFKQICKLILVNKLPVIARAFDVSVSNKSVGKSFKHTILSTMEIRKKNNIFRPDMINIMMQVRDGTLKYQNDDDKKDQEGFATVEESEVGKIAVNRKWNDDEIVAQCFLFLAAGFDTSSTLLTFVSYELTTNPDCQQKLYEEIAEMDQQLGGKRIGYEALQKLKYMDQVICETLRKWPPFSQLDRVCVKDLVLEINDELKLKVEKGNSFVFSIYGIQHDPKYFPEPEKFDPERFNDENKKNIVSGSYLPFGIGPRNCIGSRFALMQVKAILYSLLLNFTFEPNENTEIPIRLKKSSFATTPENGFNLELKPRKK